RIETFERFDQPGALLRRARPATHALDELGMTRAQARRPLASESAAKQRLVLDDRLGRLAPRCAPRSSLAPPISRPLLDADGFTFPAERRPVEIQVGMRVFEGLARFLVERPAPHPDMGRRPEEIQDARR